MWWKNKRKMVTRIEFRKNFLNRVAQLVRGAKFDFDFATDYAMAYSMASVQGGCGERLRIVNPNTTSDYFALNPDVRFAYLAEWERVTWTAYSRLPHLERERDAPFVSTLEPFLVLQLQDNF